MKVARNTADPEMFVQVAKRVSRGPNKRKSGFQKGNQLGKTSKIPKASSGEDKTVKVASGNGDDDGDDDGGDVDDGGDDDGDVDDGGDDDGDDDDGDDDDDDDGDGD